MSKCQNQNLMISDAPISDITALQCAIQGPLTVMIGSGVSLRGNIAPGVNQFITHILEGLTNRSLTVDPVHDYASYRIGLLVKQMLHVKGSEASIQDQLPPLPVR